MAITETDINEMLAFLVTHPEYQERFRTVTAAPELSQIPSRMDRVEAVLERQVVAGAATDARIDRLATRMDILTDRMTGLTERVDVLAEKIDRLGDTVGAMASRFDALTGEVAITNSRVDTLSGRTDQMNDRLDKLSGDVGNIKGGQLESKYHDNIENWFSIYVASPRKVSYRSVEEVVEAQADGVLTPADVTQLRAVDLMVRGLDQETGEETVLAVEVSNVIDTRDVSRAADRPALLEKTGCRARGMVGGYSILDAAREEALRRGAIIDLHEGR